MSSFVWNIRIYKYHIAWSREKCLQQPGWVQVIDRLYVGKNKHYQPDWPLIGW